MPASLHPTKEQVRAYMHLRECDRRPPPTPDEIRRQLGWYSDDEDHAAAYASSGWFLPDALVQLAALTAVSWCFLAAGSAVPACLYTNLYPFLQQKHS